MKEFNFPRLELEETLYTLEQLTNAGQDNVHIALAGRSNVGKSSLINALGKRKQLAKVSATPGKTRSVNLYRVLPQDFYLTDLPGYGYAKRSKSERELWGNLIEQYLLECPNLAAIAILLDCRLDPQEADKMMVQFALDNHIPIIPILTKADKCSQKERSMRQAQWSVLIRKDAMPVSAHSGLGLADLWQEIIDVALEFKEDLEIQEREDAHDDTSCDNETSNEASNNITDEVSTDSSEANSVSFESSEGMGDAAESHSLPTTKVKERTKRGSAVKNKKAEEEKAKKKAKVQAQAEKNRQKHQSKRKSK